MTITFNFIIHHSVIQKFRQYGFDALVETKVDEFDIVGFMQIPPENDKVYIRIC